MKNPWMSLWLSAANAQASVGRGLFAAGVKRAQKAALDDMRRQTVAFWMGQTPAKPKPAARKRRSARR